MITPSLWTAIIPAAGRGSRLGFDKPKILFPVAGRMIIEWLIDLLLPQCQTIVFVLSPDGRATVEAELNRLIPGRFRIAIQEVPTGMGDAVALGLADVDTKHVVIVWGDQVALLPESVAGCLEIQQGPQNPDLTCPTVIRQNPYIHFERDASGKISRLLQKREGDTMPTEGESDTGFFCFRTESLRHALRQLRAADDRGSSTGEFNFLPIIPLLAQSGIVLTPHVMKLEETVGVNSKEDALLLEPVLRNRR